MKLFQKITCMYLLLFLGIGKAGYFDFFTDKKVSDPAHSDLSLPKKLIVPEHSKEFEDMDESSLKKEVNKHGKILQALKRTVLNMQKRLLIVESYIDSATEIA